MVVSGASTGIGRATARMLAEAGFTVWAGVRKEADRVALTSGRVRGVVLDVTDSGQIRALAERVRAEAGGRLDGLVSNAGIFVGGPVEGVSMAQWRRQFDVNFFGMVELTQAMLPFLRAARGRVVNTSSIGGLATMATMGVYQSSKYAVESFSDALRMELAPLGVHVSILEPGAIRTEIMGKTMTDVSRTLAEMSPEQRAVYGPMTEAALDIAPVFERNAIPPEKCGAAVLHAMTARKPRTRYLVGRDAQLILLLKRTLPTRWFDAVMMKGLKMDPASVAKRSQRPGSATPRMA